MLWIRLSSIEHQVVPKLMNRPSSSGADKDFSPNLKEDHVMGQHSSSALHSGVPDQVGLPISWDLSWVEFDLDNLEVLSYLLSETVWILTWMKCCVHAAFSEPFRVNFWEAFFHNCLLLDTGEQSTH